jgi:hypothetical protein
MENIEISDSNKIEVIDEVNYPVKREVKILPMIVDFENRILKFTAEKVHFIEGEFGVGITEKILTDYKTVTYPIEAGDDFWVFADGEYASVRQEGGSISHPFDKDSNNVITSFPSMPEKVGQTVYPEYTHIADNTNILSICYAVALQSGNNTLAGELLTLLQAGRFIAFKEPIEYVIKSVIAKQDTLNRFD